MLWIFFFLAVVPASFLPLSDGWMNNHDDDAYDDDDDVKHLLSINQHFLFLFFFACLKDKSNLYLCR